MALYSSGHVTLTAPAGVNTKGNYTELFASTAEAIKGFLLSIDNASGGSRSFCIDIATGAAGAETVVVADVLWANATNFNINCPAIWIPLALPSGVRVAARCQSSGVAPTCHITVILVGGSGGGTTATTYGAVTGGATAGTTIDPGTTLNTKGAYTEIVASTPAALDWLIVLLSGRRNTAPAGALFQLDIATGAAGSESILIPDICFSSNAGTGVFNPLQFHFPVSIAAGTRLAARAQAGTTDATDRLFDVELIGVTGSQGGAAIFVPILVSQVQQIPTRALGY